MTSGRGYQTDTMEQPINTDPTGSSSSNRSKNTFAGTTTFAFEKYPLMKRICRPLKP